ncbi:unnamed protein product [Absidia cylindrospora]
MDSERHKEPPPPQQPKQRQGEPLTRDRFTTHFQRKIACISSQHRQWNGLLRALYDLVTTKSSIELRQKMNTESIKSRQQTPTALKCLTGRLLDQKLNHDIGGSKHE